MSVARSDEAKDVVAPLTLAPPSAEQFRLLVGSVQGYAIMMLDTAGRLVS